MCCFRFLTRFCTPQELTDFKSKLPRATTCFHKHFQANLLSKSKSNHGRSTTTTTTGQTAGWGQDEDRMELPEIRLKYLNPSSLCLSCSHQEPWPPPAAAAAAAAVAAAMWEELSTNKGCPRPAEAESPSLPYSRSLPSSHMRTRRWLSPAGSPSTSWRSSFSCCPLQVCHDAVVITRAVQTTRFNNTTSIERVDWMSAIIVHARSTFTHLNTNKT